MLYSIMVISLGASLGAVSRWLLGLALNSLFPLLPPGTLAANLIGAFLAGVALNVFMLLPEIGGAWRLFVLTGFLGGLTTFSTFSMEVSLLLQGQRVGMALLAIALHVGGSLLFTLLGFGTLQWVGRLLGK